MRINIYQIDSDKDNNRVKFDSYRRTLENGGINPAIYKCVFHGDVDGDLEDVYTLFNGCDHPGTYQGHSLSVSDIVEVIGDSEDIESGSYFVDSIGFKKLPDFDSTQCAEMDGLRMLMIQPHRTPIVTYVKDDLAALQRAVSDHCEESYIEYTYPFEDDCMILGNEEAKLNGMEGNRRLGNGIYAGPIFVTRDDGIGGLCSLTEEQVQKYSEMFAKPQDISPEETQADVGFTFYGW